MPCKEVDGAAIRIDRKRDFGQDLPPGGLDERCRLTKKRRVTLVQQAIDLASSPAHDDVDVSAERLGVRVTDPIDIPATWPRSRSKIVS
jgi:hypothetical protein